jgi:hypothetical protein
MCSLELEHRKWVEAVGREQNLSGSQNGKIEIRKTAAMGCESDIIE